MATQLTEEHRRPRGRTWQHKEESAGSYGRDRGGHGLRSLGRQRLDHDLPALWKVQSRLRWRLLPGLWLEAVMEKHPAAPLLPLSCQGLHVRNPAGSQQQGELTNKSTGASSQRQRAEQSRGGEGLNPRANHPGPAHTPFLHGNHLWSSLIPSTPPTLFLPASIMYEHIDIFFSAI